MQLLYDRSLQNSVCADPRKGEEIKEQVLYSNHALSIFNEQEIRAQNYAAVMVGRGLWSARRIGILTNTVRI